MSINSNLDVTLEGRGKVTLRPMDHIATGGEGSVYRLNKTVVKVFTDPQKMTRDDMSGKIVRLSKIKHSWITAPEGRVLDGRNKPVGYYMPYAPGEGLPLFFTNDHRTQVGFADAEASVLADRMRQVVQIAHDNTAVIVDGNEYGWLVEYSKGSKPEPHIVDVDSWQIDQWRAAVIMPSIVDHHTKGFNHLSDWFSWGIVSFQVYTGIHPYKGTLEGYSRSDFVGRMKKNASVFSPGVRLNLAVRDFGCIPPRLRDWYVETFQHGKRSIPPSPFDSGITTTPSIVVQRVNVTSATGSIRFDRLTSTAPADPAIKVFFCGAALLASNKIIDLASRQHIATSNSHACEVVKAEGGWLIAEKQGERVEYFYSEGRGHKQKLDLTLAASGVFRYQNRLFAIMKEGITELILKKFATPILTVGQTWGTLTSSTKWFDGIGVQDALGATYLIAPYSEGKLSYVRVKELDGFQPVNGRSGERFSTIIAANKKGELFKFEFVFDKNYSEYKLLKEEVDTPELVLAILPKGVSATVVKDGELKIIVPTTNTERLIADRTIATNEPLFAWDNNVLLLRGGNVWQIKVN